MITVRGGGIVSVVLNVGAQKPSDVSSPARCRRPA
jgi:hypothetical protein